MPGPQQIPEGNLSPSEKPLAIAAPASLNNAGAATGEATHAEQGRLRRAIVWTTIAFLPLCAWPPKLSPNSLYYFDIAKTLATKGRGASHILRVTSLDIPDRDLPRPPGYPFLLALGLKIGASPELAAFLLNVLGYGVLFGC